MSKNFDLSQEDTKEESVVAKPTTKAKPKGSPQVEQTTHQNEGYSAPSSSRPVFGITNRLANQGVGGNAYEVLYGHFLKALETLNSDGSNNYSVIRLLKERHGLNYSGIILSYKTKDNRGRSVVNSHVLMVERTGDYPSSNKETINGEVFEIIRTPAEALDETYIKEATLAVASFLNVDVKAVNFADGTLVPNEFDVTNENHVNQLLINTVNSVLAETSMQTEGYTGVNIAETIKDCPKGNFYVTLYFNSNNVPHYNQVGMPIRQDICIELTFKENQNQFNRSINQGDDIHHVVKTYGYIDFEFSTSPGAYGIVPSQKFIPNFVITHIDSPNAVTPDLLMLAIASVTTLNEDLNWAQAFRPTPGSRAKGDIDFNDIGALNIEGNIENNPNGFGKRFDMKSPKLTPIDFSNFIQTLVHRNFLVSIDLPKAGPETWYTSILDSITQPGEKSVEATGRMNKVLKQLTNGAFTTNSPMFVSYSNMVHGGYYLGKNGPEDIRSISSYLAVSNFVETAAISPALISEYANTLYRQHIPTDLRAAKRRSIINQITADTAVYKHTYNRATFTAGFLNDLVSSLRSVGFAPSYKDSTINGNDIFTTRSEVDLSGALLNPEVRLTNAQNYYGNRNYQDLSYTRRYF